MKKILYGLIGILVLAFVARLVLPTSINDGKDLPKLTREDILTQTDEEYAPPEISILKIQEISGKN